METQLSRDTGVDNQSFVGLIQDETRRLLDLCIFAADKSNRDQVMSRYYLGEMNLTSTRLEEILDTYGAKHNSYWFPFREYVAVAKIFSDAAYSLIILANSIPSMDLLPVEKDFTGETVDILEDVIDIIVCNADSLVRLAAKIGFPIPEAPAKDMFYEEALVPGLLVSDRKKRQLNTPGRTVVYLATAFLNLAEESSLLEIYRRVKASDYASCIPDTISEEHLMVIENKFHSLQSLYDTYLSESNVEDHDQNLRILKSHISVIYRLLETATQFAHFYERHIDIFDKGLKFKFVCPVKPKDLLSMLMQYSVAFASQYINAAKVMCRDMIKQYAERGEIKVTIPVYRGFHVRPSTMIAKIIQHYGGKVFMRLGGEEYNAASPLELFRANEKINAKKRQVLGEEILKLPAVQKARRQAGNNGDADMTSLMKLVCIELLERKKLIMYDNEFTCNNLSHIDDESVVEYVKRWLANCLAMGRIDIWIDEQVRFIGDKRILADIKLLADHGYGEDSFGNNIVLPKELSYLRR